MYHELVPLLEAGLTGAINSGARKCTYKQSTYIGDPTYITVNPVINGLTTIQYTPWQETKGGRQMAAVQVWVEDKITPVIPLKTWVALPGCQK